MLALIIDEWMQLCQDFLEVTQDRHKWTTSVFLIRIWEGVARTKHFNASLLTKCEETLRYLSLDYHRWFIGEVVSVNPSVTMDMVLKYPDFPWIFSTLSKHIHINDILQNPDYKWNWDIICKNRSVTLDVILSNRTKEWDWKILSRHPNITMSDIESHMNLPWDWKNVSDNPNLTMSMIEKYPDKGWDWNNIGDNIKLSVDLLREYSEKSWDFFHMSMFNPSITLELLLATIDLPWDFGALSCNPCVTIDMLLAFPDRDWKWEDVSSNVAITIMDIELNLELPWIWRSVCSNPNLRMYATGLFDQTQDMHGMTECLFNPDEYFDEMCCKYSVLSMHDEDYGRGKESLDYDNALDLVIQNEYCVGEILTYI